MNQCRSTFQMQLLFDLGAVHVHGARADVELLGDLIRGIAAADELENFKFPTSVSVFAEELNPRCCELEPVTLLRIRVDMVSLR